MVYPRTGTAFSVVAVSMRLDALRSVRSELSGKAATKRYPIEAKRTAR